MSLEHNHLAFTVCTKVLQELEEELPIASEDEWHEVRALLFDFYGHGIHSHTRLKRLMFTSFVNRRLENAKTITIRPSYYGWGNGVMGRFLQRDAKA